MACLKKTAAVMCDHLMNSSLVPYTFFQVDTCNELESYPLQFEKKNIFLEQEPSEKLDFKFFQASIGALYNYSCEYTCEVEINFHNNLHEISKDYIYEVHCKGYVQLQEQLLNNPTYSSEYNNESHHITYFNFCEKRVGSKLMKRYYFLKLTNLYELKHLCFYIRRYNNLINEAKDTGIVDVGSLLYSTKAYSDVSLVVNGTTLQAHKQILMQSSEVFRAMFTHKMTETTTDTVIIEDLDADVVQAMLSYVYTGKTGNIAHIWRDLLGAANRYQLFGLRRFCMEYIAVNMNGQSIVEILEVAHLYELDELRDSAMAFVHSHEDKMALEPSFQDYLNKTIKLNNVAETLLLAHKLKMENVKKVAFQFIKDHSSEIVEDEEFMILFEKIPILMKEVFTFIHKKDAEL